MLKSCCYNELHYAISGFGAKWRCSIKNSYCVQYNMHLFEVLILVKERHISGFFSCLRQLTQDSLRNETLKIFSWTMEAQSEKNDYNRKMTEQKLSYYWRLAIWSLGTRDWEKNWPSKANNMFWKRYSDSCPHTGRPPILTDSNLLCNKLVCQKPLMVHI